MDINSHLSFALVSCVLFAPLSAYGLEPRCESPNQVSVETIGLAGMPVGIDSAAVEDVDGKNYLRCRITNQADETIRRVRMGLISYSIDGHAYQDFPLDGFKLATGSTTEVSQEVSEDLSQVKRLILTVLLAQSEDHVWFLDAYEYFRFQKDVIGAAASSMPNVNCCKVTKKILRRRFGLAPSITPDSCGPQLPENPLVDTKPVALNNPQLTYTEDARKYGIQGAVHLRALVEVDGSVSRVIVISGLPDGLNEEALSSAYKLKFKPATNYGQPVAFWQDVEMEFALSR